MSIPGVCARGHVNEPPPPGETGVELTGSDAIEAMHDALVTISKPADKKLSLRDIDFKRIGRFIVAHVELQDGTMVIEFDVRMSRERAQEIARKFNRVFDK